MTSQPAGQDTTTYIAAREALLALVAMAADQADHANDTAGARLWAGRRDAWSQQWRELRPDDVDAQRRILTEDAALLRDRDGLQ